jgi:hypothetical protein
MKKNNKENPANTNNNQVPGSLMAGQQDACRSGSAGYEIRVKDHLETYWFEWFDGWSVTNLDNGEVLLKSFSVDQSKLHGTLNKVRDLNLTLLSVACIPAEDQTNHPSAGDHRKDAK